MPIERQRIGSAPFRLSERILDAPTSYGVLPPAKEITSPVRSEIPEEVVTTERIMIKNRLLSFVTGLMTLVALSSFLPFGSPSAQQPASDVAIDNDDIGGVVTGPKGPEAGVWVIAETRDLPVRYIKSVVTDDRGRFVVPDLPPANYQVWARGYGLVDSAKIDGKAWPAPRHHRGRRTERGRGRALLSGDLLVLDARRFPPPISSAARAASPLA